MDNAQQPELSENDFIQLTQEALEWCAQGGTLTLALPDLAYKDLVAPYFFKDEIPGESTRGDALLCMLTWAVEQLKPSGKENLHTLKWRNYTILYYGYLITPQPLNNTELANKLSVSVAHLLQNLRPEAIESLAIFLYQITTQVSLTLERQHWAIQYRYNRSGVDEQQLLRFLAVFQRPLPLTALYRLSEEADFEIEEQMLNHLAQANLIAFDQHHQKVAIQPELVGDIPYQSAYERHVWHTLALDYFEQREDYFQIARHRYALENALEAAKTLVEHKTKLFKEEDLVNLQSLLSQFEVHDVGEGELWFELNLMAGQVAQHNQDIQTALHYFQEVIGADTPLLKAQGLFYYAEANRGIDFHVSKKYYQRSIDLLEQMGDNPQLLGKVLVKCTWIFMQEGNDLVGAEVRLQRAKQLEDVFEKDPLLRCDYHNAWAMFYGRRKQQDLCLEHNLEAYLAAKEGGDAKRTLDIAHNLGLAYAWDWQDYEKALYYLNQCINLSLEIGNHYLVAICYKTIGNCYFFQGEYPQVIHYAHLALDIFETLGQRNWQGAISFDLAEAYFFADDILQAKHYLDKAKELAEAVNNQDVLRAISGFVAEHPDIFDVTLTEQEQAILAYVKEQGNISSAIYAAQYDCSRRTANRHLMDLVDRGFLVYDKRKYWLPDGEPISP